MPKRRLRQALRTLTDEALNAKSMAAGLLVAPDLPEPRRDIIVQIDRRLRRLMQDLADLTDALPESDAKQQLRLPYAYGA